MTTQEAFELLRQIDADITRMRASIDQLEAAFVDLLLPDTGSSDNAEQTSPTNPPTLGRR
jgi:hypothetical protein